MNIGYYGLVVIHGEQVGKKLKLHREGRIKKFNLTGWRKFKKFQNMSIFFASSQPSFTYKIETAFYY